MKVVTDFDLMNEIATAENALSFDAHKKGLTKTLKTVGALYGIWTGIDLMNPSHGIKWKANTMIGLIDFSLFELTDLLLHVKYKDEIEAEAYLKLVKLTLQLADMGVNTSFELLKDSEVDSTKYEIRLNERQLPVIKQNKYILVPTYDSPGKIGNTSLLQEHDIGSDKYVLSLGSPKKVRKLSPAFSC